MLVGSLQNQESIFAKSRIHLTIQTLARLHGRLGTVLPNFVEKLHHGIMNSLKSSTCLAMASQDSKKCVNVKTGGGLIRRTLYF